MKTIAVLYATRHGQTKKIAERVARNLRKRGFNVTARNVLDPAAAIDLLVCQGAILAASVHVGRHEREMVNFVKDHRSELERLPTTAFLSVSLSAAGAERANSTAEQLAKCRAGVHIVLDRLFRQTGWCPRHVKPVAGALLYTKYNAFIRFVMKQIAKSAGGDTDTSRDYEYTEWPALDAFIDGVADEIQSLQPPSLLQAEMQEDRDAYARNCP